MICLHDNNSENQDQIFNTEKVSVFYFMKQIRLIAKELV